MDPQAAFCRDAWIPVSHQSRGNPALKDPIRFCTRKRGSSGQWPQDSSNSAPSLAVACLQHPERHCEGSVGGRGQRVGSWLGGAAPL